MYSSKVSREQQAISWRLVPWPDASSLLKVRGGRCYRRHGRCMLLISVTASLSQDADDTAKLLEKEGTDAVLLAEDLSQGEQVCKKIVDEVGR